MRPKLVDFFRGLLSSSSYRHSDWEEHHLTARHWRTFEELVAQLWQDMGYNTELIQGSRDGGIDVIATETSRIPLMNPPTIAIQVKQWSDKVNEREIRDLFGVQKGGHRHSSVDWFDESILVTSSGCTSDQSGFTRGARQFADNTGVALVDGETLLSLLNESNLSPLSLGRKSGQKWHLRESPCCGWSNRFNQNQAYAETAEEVFNTTTQRIEPTETSESVTMEEICKRCLNLRLE